MTTTVDVVKLERLRYDALVGADVAALQRLLSNDVRYIHTNGISDTKSSLIESLVDGTRKYLGVQVISQELRVYGDFSILTGELAISYIARGVSNDMRVAHTSVWRIGDTDAQLVSWHSSPSTFKN